MGLVCQWQRARHHLVHLGIGSCGCQDVEASVSSLFHWRSVEADDIMPSTLVSGQPEIDRQVQLLGLSLTFWVQCQTCEYAE